MVTCLTRLSVYGRWQDEDEEDKGEEEGGREVLEQAASRLAMRARMMVGLGALVLLLSGVSPVAALVNALWGLETARSCGRGGSRGAHWLWQAISEVQV